MIALTFKCGRCGKEVVLEFKTEDDLIYHLKGLYNIESGYVCVPCYEGYRKLEDKIALLRKRTLDDYWNNR